MALYIGRGIAFVLLGCGTVLVPVALFNKTDELEVLVMMIVLSEPAQFSENAHYGFAPQVANAVF